MNIYEYDVMNYLLEEDYSSQRIIAESTNYSLGKVNEAIQKLTAADYLNGQLQVTQKALEEIEIKRPKNAIILAAGFGMRMVPINTETPKGLLEVKGETLIERLIKQLHAAGVTKIDVVVGFMKDKFEFLIDQYGVNLVYNPDYALKNNIHSLNLLADKVSNTYILPSDIWFEKNPFSKREFYSWYSVTEKSVKNSLRINRQRQLVPVPEGKLGNEMIGIAYLLEAEGKKLRENIRQLTTDSRWDDVFWERALFHGPEKIDMYARIYPVAEAFEINTYEELRELDSASNHLDTEIIRLIARELEVDTKEVKNITVLKKGMTNRSFKFSVKDKDYIMRIPGEGTDQLINRENEYNVYQKIKDLKISDDLVYISPENGYKITEFLDDARECDAFNPDDVKQAMRTLRQFHSLRLEVNHTFDIFKEIQLYESFWKGKPSIFKDYEKTKKNIYSLKPFIDSLDKDWILTHVDANADNILFLENDIRMIDWEYAGMQDPDLDIAMFAIYSLYDRPQVDALIDSYYIEGITEEKRMKIYAYIAISGLLWSNWCEFKRFEGVEFGEYSLRQYRYAKDYYDIVMDEWLKNNEENKGE